MGHCRCHPDGMKAILTAIKAHNFTLRHLAIDTNPTGDVLCCGKVQLSGARPIPIFRLPSDTTCPWSANWRAAFASAAPAAPALPPLPRLPLLQPSLLLPPTHLALPSRSFAPPPHPDPLPKLCGDIIADYFGDQFGGVQVSECRPKINI